MVKYIINLFNSRTVLLTLGVWILQACSLPTSSTLSIESTEFMKNPKLTMVNYNSTEALVKLSAEFIANKADTNNTIKVYTNSSCSAPELVTGTAAQLSENVGILFKLPIATQSKIYVSTNTIENSCNYILDFIFTSDQVPNPNLTNFSPSSPSLVSFAPLVFGTALTNSTVKLYSDLNCTVLVGSGSDSDFKNTGIIANLAAESTTSVYAQTTDSQSKKSSCTYLADYTHSTTRPAIPVYVSTSPISPNNYSVTPKIKGTVASGTTTVKLFNDSACANELASQASSEFTNLGISINVNSNATTSIYAKAINSSGIDSLCGYLTNYTHDSTAPVVPQYSSADPTTPTRLTTYPKIIGVVSSETAVVRLYDSLLCLNTIGFGTKNEFQTTGIVAGLLPNNVTGIYAKSFDSANNGSACTFLVNYKHNTIPPDIPVFGSTDPASPNNISPNPNVLGSASFTTKNIYFYSDEFCTLPMGSGTAETFNTTGIPITTPNVPNSVNITTLYVTADDEEGNVSECTAISNYGYSTAKAPNPSFLQTIPLSPSKNSTNPWVLGTAPTSVTSVSIYTDILCTQFVGTASRAAFAAQGIQVSVPANATSSLYSVSTDVYGNSSDCVYFTSYTHDNLAPIVPTYLSSNPLSPNKTSITPEISGGVTLGYMGKPLQITKVNLYDSFLCLNKIGTSSPSVFVASGTVANVPSNAVTNIYANTEDDAGNLSTCTHMLDYTHSDRAPGAPILVSTTPATPSFTRSTAVKGSIGTSTAILAANNVTIYKDAACTQQMSTGSVATFTSSGITTLMDRNVITPVYARSTNVVGSQSGCIWLLDYFHNDIGPSNLQAIQNTNGSVLLTWLPDSTASPVAKYNVKRSNKTGGPYTVIAWNNAGTQFTDLNVTEGETYFYVVSATNNTGFSLNSSEVNITVNSNLVQTPTLLQATAGSGSVALQWLGYAPNLFYKVLRATQSGGPYTIIKKDLEAVTYVDNTVTNSNNYFYIVIGTNPEGESTQSNEASARPTAVSMAPTNLIVNLVNSSASCGGGRGVELSWTAPTHYNNFVVTRGISPGNKSDLVTLGNSYYVDCNISYDNDERYYSVAAIWGTGPQSVRSDYSNEVSAFFTVEPSVNIFPGNNEIALTWNTITNADSYQVWRSIRPMWPNNTFNNVVSGSSYVMLSPNEVSTAYNDSTVVNGQEYFYVVVPNRNGAQGWGSAEVSGIPGSMPSAPTNLKVTQGSGAALVQLNWTAPTHYNRFNVYRATNIGGPYLLVNTSNGPSYTDAPPAVGMYYYYVKAVWGSAETAATNTVNYRYGYPLSLSITPNASQLTLTWSGVTGASNYRVLRSETSKGPYTEIASTTLTSIVNSTTAPVAYPASAALGYFYVIQPEFADFTQGQYSPEASSKMSGTNVTSGLTVTGTSLSSVSLTWATLPGTANYNIYKSTSASGTYTLEGTTSLTSYTVGGLIFNTTYYFVVTRSGCALSCPSNVVNALTVANPSTPTVKAGTNNVQVQWSNVTGGSTYDVYRSTDSSTFSLLQANISSGTYTDNSATNGNLYFYKVRVTYTNSSVQFSNSSQGVTPGVIPLAPTKIYLEDNSTGTEVLLGWAKIFGAASYNVYLSTSSGGPYVTPAVNTTANSGNFLASLTTGQTYYAVVRSVNGNLESANSPEFSFVPSVAALAPTLVNVPTGIYISWSAVPSATQYDVLRSLDNVNFTKVSDHQGALNFTDTSVIQDVTYYYKITPYNGGGHIMAPSASAGPINVNPTLMPSALLAQGIDVNTAKLSWVVAPSPQTTGYKVYRSTVASGPYSLVSTVGSTVNEYLDSGLSAGTTYYYVLSALNSFGVESTQTNEVSVSLLAGPVGLNAVNNANNIDLTWSAVGSAIGYKIYRSYNSGGPYGLISTLGVVTNYTDNQTLNGEQYYYVVQALFSGVIPSVYSNEANVVAVKTINLRHPIELTDLGISSDNLAITFERTRTSVDTAAYNGTVHYDFEVVGQNTGSSPYTVELLDDSNAVVSSIVIPALTNDFTRIAASATLNAGYDTYRVKLPSTSVAGEVQILTARIWVDQTAATKTKLYIPLTSSYQSPLSGDLYASLASTNQSGYMVVDASSFFKRDSTKYSALPEYNAWELEVLTSTFGSSGAVGLMNQNTGQMVTQTEIEFTDANITLTNSPFDEGTSQFTDSQNNHIYRLAYQCYLDCSNGPVNIYKAGLWVNLINMSKAEVLIRNAISVRNINTLKQIENQRTVIDLSRYSNPVVNFRATASADVNMGDYVTLDLMTNGQGGGADYGLAFLSAVPSSTLTFNSSSLQLQQTAAPLTINSGDRFLPQLTLGQGLIGNVQDSFIVIQISP